ncbi:hypothetical protein B0J15DRAFT_488929 [Fusarium solani]|uniref:Secreted protein n=1 Tax=Fusarium solani TaxID=169388 RepID=A0A9P9KQA8_FUSSL|nr:uncharacterized protein B0J15DRAFT_488929 [Fusarium solani]KAH7266551.1 hypothetical protein B0J15DRAFT_488929 [Fusarium solani]
MQRPAYLSRVLCFILEVCGLVPYVSIQVDCNSRPSERIVHLLVRLNRGCLGSPCCHVQCAPMHTPTHQANRLSC